MKKILLSSALAGGLAAVTIGMAAPASAAPSWTAPPQPGDSVMLNGPKAPADPHNYERMTAIRTAVSESPNTHTTIP